MAAQRMSHPGIGNRLRIAAWGLAAGLLMLPAVAMQFSHEVVWGAIDFLVAGALIGGTGLVFELAVRAHRSGAYRAGAAVALLTAFLTIWVNAAVGMIGDEDNPRNLIFAGVLAVAGGGSLFARFRPAGMVWAMLAAAAVQIAAILPTLAEEPRTVPLVGAFALPWLLAAALFRAAGRQG